MKRKKKTALHATCSCVFLLSLMLPNLVSAATYTVTNTNDSGPGSLRQAILDANANTPVSDLIEFNIPGGGPQTITPLTALPVITDPVRINGTSQPGYPTSSIVELDGSNTGSNDYGFHIQAGGSTIRGLVINRFSGNDGGGIYLNTNGGNTIQGNYIGTDTSGSSVSANHWGINMQSSDGNTIGGSDPGQGNVISGNSSMGIRISTSDNNVIQGNFIGTDATGASALGNGQGLWVSNSHENSVGGLGEGEGNVISGNGVSGISMNSSNRNEIYGNTIGLDASRSTGLGNTFSGVEILSGTRNGILSNSIFSNGELGIDLDPDGSHPPDGVTANDPGDADTGANNLQNFPVLTSATLSESGLFVEGDLNSAADSSYTIEFFSNTSCDASGNGEGRVFLGSAPVQTNVSGDASISESLPRVSPGSSITATATDSLNNTSEFSACITVPPPTTSVTPLIFLPLLSD